MDKLKVTIALGSPLITNGGYMTLDAVLAAQLFDQSGDLEAAHSNIPLRNTAGLWHASAAIFEPLEVGRKGFVANLRASHDLDPDLLAKNAEGKIHRKLGLTRRSDFGAVLNSYTLVAANELVWYAEGDAQRVQQLLAGVDFVGKRRASGYGQVVGLRVEPGDLDGVTGHFDEPLRPVPLELFAGDKTVLRVDAAWRPAYWHPENRAICYVPPGLA